jgi:ectoine hydroxylase-related dioxygenase (phytanoyl-CoA dioxygenase family)
VRLHAKEIDSFFSIGYVVRPQLFSGEEVSQMREAFDRLQQTASRLAGTCMHRGAQFVVSPAGPGQPRMRIHRVVWCGAAEPVLSAFGRDLRLLRMAAQLLGSSRMNQLINQAHFKLPHDGVEFPWHQDSVHRRYGRGEWQDANGRGSYVQTLVAVDDMTEENGPLQFLPGSCRLGHCGLPEGQLPEAESDPGRPATVTMRAGDVALFGPYVFHRSLPNRSSSPRRAFINGFAYPGANARLYPGRGAGRLLSVG